MVASEVARCILHGFPVSTVNLPIRIETDTGEVFDITGIELVNFEFVVRAVLRKANGNE